MAVMTLALIISSIYSINAFIVDFVIMHAGTGKEMNLDFMHAWRSGLRGVAFKCSIEPSTI